jgi:Tfp pilus assembly protein PilO
MPSQNPLYPFLADVERRAESLMIRDFGYRQEAEQVGDLHRKLPVLLEFEGDYVNVFTLLRHIESLPRMTRTSQLQLTEPQGETGTGQVRCQMRVELYYRTAN